MLSGFESEHAVRASGPGAGYRSRDDYRTVRPLGPAADVERVELVIITAAFARECVHEQSARTRIDGRRSCDSYLWKDGERSISGAEIGVRRRR